MFRYSLTTAVLIGLSLIGLAGISAPSFAADGPASILVHPASRTVLQGTPTTFTVTADGTPPLSYQWRKDGVGIAGETGASLTLSSAQPADEARYSVAVSNALGQATSSEAELLVDPGTITGTQTNNLFGFTQPWRYNQTQDLSAINWFTNSYSDASWSGPGGGLLYVEDAALSAPKTTALTLGRLTYYFRTPFVVSNATDMLLSGTFYVDDGAVIYLNGEVLHRLGMDEGPVNYSTPANRTAGDAAAEGPTELPTTALRNGTNLLAVEVHQINSTSSDIVWGMSLSGLTFTRGPDTIRPTIAASFSATNNRVMISFSERVEPATATNITNYSINNGITVSAAYFTNDNRTIALVTSALATDVPYTVTISNVRDRAVTPNIILAGSTSTFTLSSELFVPQPIGNPVVSGSVAAVAGGYNITAGGTNIAGNSDQFTFNHRPVTGNFDYRVRLAGLRLADTWSKAGLMARETLTANSPYAATFATPSVGGAFAQWRATLGGATANSGSYPVNYPNTWLRLQRSGNLFTSYASLDGEAWYQLGSVTIAMSSGVYLGMAASAAVPNGSATPTTVAQFREFTPVVGATVAVALPNVEPPGPSSRKSPFAITEIMYNPLPNANSNVLEFIEIYNSNPFIEDLSGYRISGDIDFVFPPGTILQGGEYRVIARNPEDIASIYGLSGVMGPYENALKDTGTIRLRNKQDAVLLEISYENVPPWPVAADGAGHSLVLARPSYGEGYAAAWSISDKVGGSPGGFDGLSSTPQRAVVINEFLANSEAPAVDFIELYNHSNKEVDLSGCTLSDEPDTNKFVMTSGTKIPPRGFLTFSQTQLGFGLSSGGETIYFRSADGQRVLDTAKFTAQASGISTGRHPDGGEEFHPLTAPTINGANATILVHDIVINEIMYKPISSLEDDEYVEIYNRGTNAISLGNWRFISGIDYRFPSNTVLAADSYLVVARNAARLLTNYPNLNTNNTWGDYDGSLRNKGERIALARPDINITTNNAGEIRTNTVFVVVDDVTYGVGGNWGNWANEGGSSLELIDARSNHRLAHNWGDSDETAKAPWTNVEFTGPMDNGSGASDFFEVLAMGEGEFLLDNAEVIPATSGVNMLPANNSNFESGLGTWLSRGTHIRSSLETAAGYGGYNSSQSLHVRASARGDTMANRSLVQLPSTPSGTITLRAKVRWLRGWPEVILRLKGNYVEAYGRLTLPSNLGTPGARNSRALTNAAPAIYAVTHNPVVPAAGQAVVVTAQVHDPDGVSTVTLKYRADTAASYTSLAMNDSGTGGDAVAGDGVFSGTIPGQAVNVMVAFQVEARDNRNATQVFPLQLPAYTRAFECLVRFGDPVVAGGFGTYRQWFTADAVSDWINRPVLSNERIFGTFVYGNFRAIYNISSKYSGSPYHQGFASPVTSGCHYSIELPHDDILLGTENFNKIHAPGNGPFDDNTAQREQTCYWFARQLGLPWNYRRFINMFVNGNRRGGTTSLMEDTETPGSDVVDSRFPDDPDGYLYKLQPWFEQGDVATGASSPVNNFSWCLLNRYISGGTYKPARYRWNYLVRAANSTANNFNPVYQLVEAANTPAGPALTANLQAVADVEQWFRTFAVVHSVGDWDHVGFRNSQNMYGYKPLNGRWQLMIWDMNIVLGNGSDAAGLNLFQVNTGDSAMGTLYSHPPFRRMYLRALKELCNGAFVPANVDPMLDAKHNAMLASGITPVGPAAIKTYIASARTSILNTVAGEEPAAFRINGTNVITTTNNLITITGEAPVDARTITINGVEYPITWTSVRAFSIQIAVSDATNLLAIKGVNVNGDEIPNIGTNLVVNYTGPIASPEAIVINEIMYNPATPDASFIEIFNTSSMAFNLTGWRVNGIDYTFPGSSISGRQYLVLAKNSPAFAAAYGTNAVPFGLFEGNLDKGGETLTLERPTTVLTTNGTTITTNIVYVPVNKVRYDDDLPWHVEADGTGRSLQLIDSTKDNRRVSNWSANPGWRQFTYSGRIDGTNNLKLYITLDSPGEVYLDDISLVFGTVADVGPNILLNGGFESELTPPWTLSTNNAGSGISTAFARSGNSSLRMIAATAGSAGVLKSIYQDINGITPSTNYTLSYWFLPTTNANNISVRTAPGSNLNPPLLSLRPALSTPGANNSVAGTLAGYDPLWLNELAPNNLTGITDNNGERDPWIEIYNSGPDTLDLSGYFLADNYTNNLTQWQFPANSSIAPGEFKVVWADGEPGQSTASEWHTSFHLNSLTGSVALVRLVLGKPQVTDYLNYAGVGPNLSYGAFPNGQPVERQTFFTVTPGAPNNAKDINVFINEWMADNVGTLADPADEQFEDWFELFNPGTTPVDLGGYWLTDNTLQPRGYEIPANGQYVIPAGGFLLVWADGEPQQNGGSRPDLHAGFSLRAAGEAIGLYAPNGSTPIDVVSFNLQTPDRTEGRFADGASNIYTNMAPTPRHPNTIGLANSAPAVNPIADRTVTLGQTLSFTVTATDPDFPSQSLGFSLDSSLPSGISINSSSGLFTWTPTPAQAPGTNTIVVRVTDSGVPALSATRSFVVTVRTPPQAIIARDGSGQVSLSFGTIPGRTYQIEYKDDLNDPLWTQLTSATVAESETLNVPDNLGGSSQRFYRIVQLD